MRDTIELKRRRDPIQARTLDRWYKTMHERLADRVLSVDEPVTDAWALLGIPDALPLVDGLLAATAKVHDLTVVTRNVRDIARTGVPTFGPFSA